MLVSYNLSAVYNDCISIILLHIHFRCHVMFLLLRWPHHGGKHNVAGAACDAASVHFSRPVRRTDILAITSAADKSFIYSVCEDCVLRNVPQGLQLSKSRVYRRRRVVSGR